MKDKIKKILERIGQGILIAGGLGAMGIYQILHIIVVWGTGLSVVYLGIIRLLEGEILWGLVVLFIGTPVVIGLLEFLFPFWLILSILWIIWTIIKTTFF